MKRWYKELEALIQKDFFPKVDADFLMESIDSPPLSSSGVYNECRFSNEMVVDGQTSRRDPAPQKGTRDRSRLSDYHLPSSSPCLHQFY